MKKIINSLLRPIGYELCKKREDVFRASGICYEVDRCSVGQTPQGEATGKAVARLVRERGMEGKSVLDLCCGVGMVGLTFFEEIGRDLRIVRELCFADINIFNLNSLRRTVAINGLNKVLGERFRCFLSDGLKGVPKGEAQFDLIVSNPPHFFSSDFKEDKLTPGKLGGFDPDWRFHKEFYEVCHEFLSDQGEVWFLENSDGANVETFLPYIQSNIHLQFIEHFDEPLLPGFFWMVTKKK